MSYSQKLVPCVTPERKLKRKRAAEKRKREAESYSHAHSVLAGADEVTTREAHLRTKAVPKRDVFAIDEDDIQQLRDEYAHQHAVTSIQDVYVPPAPKKKKISLESYRARRNVQPLPYVLGPAKPRPDSPRILITDDDVIPGTKVIESGFQPVHDEFVNSAKLLEEFEGFMEAWNGRIPSTMNGLRWVIDNSSTDTLTALLRLSQAEEEEKEAGRERSRNSMKRKRKAEGGDYGACKYSKYSRDC